MKHLVLRSAPNEELSAKWRAMLDDAPFATSYVSPAYFDDPYVTGDRFAVIAFDDDDSVIGVATGTYNGDEVTSGMFSRPQMTFRNGAETAAAAMALFRGFEEITNGRPALIEVHSWEPLEKFAIPGFNSNPSTAEISVVMLDLSVGIDAIFKGFSQTRRNELRKAEKLRLVTVKEPDTAAELGQLFEIYCDWHRRKGSEPDSIEKMHAAAAQRDSRRILIAKAGDRVIAGSFYRFYRGGMVEYASNYSLPEHQRLRPNDLIGWHAIQWACRERFRHFSMGGSHLFLRRFGGETITTWGYRRDERPMSVSKIRSGVRGFGIEAYRRLPENVRAGVRRVFAR